MSDCVNDSMDGLVWVDGWFRYFPSDRYYITRCTRGVRVVFSRSIMRFSNIARMNKSNFTTERKSCSVQMTVFEIGVHCNVDSWIQLLT